ncbi:MAG TPA: YajD family HNH nuclease [Agitococcus sp.]|nr:YajD family HNH nuclease [Pseudomonadales bacterium]MCP5177305.1 HNH nuclease family protein [Moraxellaceae bacterium]HQV22576.1 YajD family HNH nuclease [Agitococcus sp.]
MSLLNDKTVAEARRNQAAREQGYREKSLKMYPHVCGRCSREFTRQNLHLLTVHHRDHNHDNNPEDGSNWELLCVYCHDEEHAKQLNQAGFAREKPVPIAKGKAFAGLADLLKAKQS